MQLDNDRTIDDPADAPVPLLRCAAEIVLGMDTTCNNSRDAYVIGRLIQRAMELLSAPSP